MGIAGPVNQSSSFVLRGEKPSFLSFFLKKKKRLHSSVILCVCSIVLADVCDCVLCLLLCSMSAEWPRALTILKTPQSVPPCFPTPTPTTSLLCLVGAGFSKIQMFSLSFWMKAMPLGFLYTLSRHDCRLRNCPSSPVVFAADCLLDQISQCAVTLVSFWPCQMFGKNKENKSVCLVELKLSSLRSLLNGLCCPFCSSSEEHRRIKAL